MTELTEAVLGVTTHALELSNREAWEFTYTLREVHAAAEERHLYHSRRVEQIGENLMRLDAENPSPIGRQAVRVRELKHAREDAKAARDEFAAWAAVLADARARDGDVRLLALTVADVRYFALAGVRSEDAEAVVLRPRRIDSKDADDARGSR